MSIFLSLEPTRKNYPSNFVRTTLRASSHLSTGYSLEVFRTSFYCPLVLPIVRYNNEVHTLWVLTELLVVVEVFKKSVAVLTNCRQSFLFWARRFQSKSSHPILRRVITFISHLCLGLQCGLFRLLLPDACHMLRQSHNPWYDRPNNNWVGEQVM